MKSKTKLLWTLAILSLLAPIAVFLWFWVLQSDHYFPGAYEDAFSAMAIALTVAVPGVLFLLIQGLTILICRTRGKTPH